MHLVAKRLIEKLGGVRAVAGMLGISTQAVNKWTQPKEKGGTGGFIPSHRQVELMVAAKHRGLELNETDFFPRRHPQEAEVFRFEERGPDA